MHIYILTGLEIIFFGGSRLLLPSARPGSKINFVVGKLYVHFVRNENILILNALASNALYRYRNAVLRNCNALFDFQMTLFYVLDNLVFAVS